MTPDLSIIVPVYSAEPYLRQCVDSILAQTCRNFELILVDDGSPDNCPSICDEYAKKDARVRVIHKSHGGVTTAICTGLEVACGDYVGFVDSDDWIDPGYFEDLYRCVTEMGADVAEAERIVELPDRSMIQIQPETVVYEGRGDIARLMEMYFTLFLYDDAKRPITPSRWDKLYRKELLLDNLRFFNPHLYLEEDVIVNAALLPDCSKVVVLSGTAKYHYRILNNSNSHRYDAEEMVRIAEFSDTLRKIAEEKDVDLTLISEFISHKTYQRIYQTMAQKGISVRTKCRRVRQILSLVPADTLDTYARVRDGGGNAFVRLFCRLLEKKIIVPCILIVMLHDILKKQ